MSSHISIYGSSNLQDIAQTLSETMEEENKEEPKEEIKEAAEDTSEDTGETMSEDEAKAKLSEVKSAGFGNAYVKYSGEYLG